ncbi:hypothetical protein BYI23_B008950 [Burkholderia sp. YI23]|uniref:Uncharacterized protein n=1 Tax=Caballeronia cordobensis TaxID=1353886 RepID=A0A158HSR2_CABCO|nr:hypothetical protein [Caballeronia cordobensis]AET91502.1 hypothetical protein BYI23_B008950 [Burkholderia sp. YI23]SAL46961.1 hypothetical protein AWB70_03702 [Caballeronia cordobensis]
MEHQTFNGLILPTDEEEEAINRGIALDPDTWELSDEEFKELKPYSVWILENPNGTEPPTAA